MERAQLKSGGKNASGLRGSWAAAAGVSAAYLAEIETGRKPGSAAALAKLAKALEVQIEELIRSSNG
jgi:DNA-binding Xre family transcriptional regulator